MKLHSLQLTNFRCFESLTIEFDPQLTVLVANNGMGKTAVLDSIAVADREHKSQEPRTSVVSGPHFWSNFGLSVV